MQTSGKIAGVLITFEGIEGCGKSTQIRLLAAELSKRQIAHTLTREPGGTPLAEAIRHILLNKGEHPTILPESEFFLFSAARADHTKSSILPALNQGKVVLCDRYLDSSTVYQGIAGGLPLELVHAVHRCATASRYPDLTILLDLPAEEGLKRIHNRQGEEGLDRIESREAEFHKSVRQGYLALAKQEARFHVIDALQSPETIQESILHRVETLLKEQN